MWLIQARRLHGRRRLFGLVALIVEEPVDEDAGEDDRKSDVDEVDVLLKRYDVRGQRERDELDFGDLGHWCCSLGLCDGLSEARSVDFASLLSEMIFTFTQISCGLRRWRHNGAAAV